MYRLQLSPRNDFDPHLVDLAFDVGVAEDASVVAAEEVAAGDGLKFGIVGAAVDDHLSHAGLQIAERVEVSLLPRVVVFPFVELIEVVDRRQSVLFQSLDVVGSFFTRSG